MFHLVARFLRWWNTPWYKRPSYCRAERISREMYYEQAERDGCEYPLGPVV